MLRFLWAYLIFMWANTRRHIGIRNNDSGEFRAAVRLYQRAYRQDPRLSQARLARAIVLWRELGECDAAIAELDVLLDEDPANHKAQLNRALAQQQAGRYRAALEDLNGYLAEPRDADEYWDVAMRMRLLLEDLLEQSE